MLILSKIGKEIENGIIPSDCKSVIFLFIKSDICKINNLV